MTPDRIAPAAATERHAILDILRGLALLGICLANFGEFSLYTFLPAASTDAMPTAGVDDVLRFLQYVFIDGKFYTLFSLLFGIGFSIMLSRGMGVFYRRMVVLLLIGLGHLIFLWAGDILILYATAGMLLPLFRRASDRGLLWCAAGLLLVPIAVDGAVGIFGWDLSAGVDRATRYFHDRAGITGENFPVWLAGARDYGDVLRFNIAGSFIRMQEFIDGNRIFKVLGLFLLGFWVGRRGIHADLGGNLRLLRRVALWGAAIGLPASVLYAWETTAGHPFGLAGHSAVYAVSVVPLALAYASALALWYHGHRELRIFAIVASPGRMALTNYILQSLFGMFIFYGIGLGLGARTGFVWAEIIAFALFVILMLGSHVWLRFYRFGPLEWIWRMLTYGKILKNKK